jgi:hypothetical protein
MKARSTWMCAVAAGGILAGAVAAYLRHHEPASEGHRFPHPTEPMEGVHPNDASPGSARLWHPWVRISRAFRSVLSTRWDATTWPITKAEMAKALEHRRQIRRAGWFN